jgi:hypothetical protein
MLHKSAHFSTLGSSRNGTVQAALLAHKYDIQQQYRFKSDGKKSVCVFSEVLGIRDSSVRIRIRGTAPVTNGSGSGSDAFLQ